MRASGPPASPLIMCVRMTCSKIAPRPAIPVAMPTWRKVLLMPEAMPLRCGSTTPTAALASVGLTIPIPSPPIRKPGNSAVHAEEASSLPISSSATPTRASPTPRSRRIGTREDSLPATGATKKETTVSGRKRRPACSGE